MYMVIFHKFRSNGWNEWTEKSCLGVVGTKEQGFEYAKREYPNLPAIEKREDDYINSNEKKVSVPFQDYIEIKKIEVLGEQK